MLSYSNRNIIADKNITGWMYDLQNLNYSKNYEKILIFE